MIRKLSLISLFTLLPASFYFAQTTVFAYVKDGQGNAVENAEVDVKAAGNDVVSDKIGYFQLVDVRPGHYQIVVSKPAFETKVIDFDVTDEKRKDLGVISLAPVLSTTDQGLTLIDNNSTDDGGTSGQASTVGLLQSSRDVFSSIASYDLGAYWFRPRGLDGREGTTMMNGVSMASGDDGRADFNNWGGLNEITRYPEIAANHSPSEYAFGGVASVIYKNTKASDYRKGSQLTYSLTNRNYRDRLSYRYTTGMGKSGWAFTAMAARRWAQEGVQQGTYYDAISGFVGIEKKLNDHHDITLNAMGSPYRKSTAGPNTQEVYDLMGTKYNPYWGWHNGEKLSERVKHGFTPIIQLSDYWTINKKASLWTTASYQFGKEYSSRLDWYKANNPSPTYYRDLPSYWLNKDATPTSYDLDRANYYTNAWQSNDPSVTQLNWDGVGGIYYQNMYGGTDGNGQKRSKYWLADDVTNDRTWNAATHFTYNFNDVTKFLMNVSYQNYYSEQYRQVKDLLGGDYAPNLYAFNDGSQSGMYNTLDTNANKVKGDKIDYDYIFRRQEVSVNPGLKFSTGPFDVFVSALYRYTSGSREGLFSHYLYKNSYGKSADQNFWDAGLKGQVVYRLNGRNFFVYNGAYYSEAPNLNDVFINARVSNIKTPFIKSKLVNANDISYVRNSPLFKLRLTGYLIDSQNDTEVQRFYADLAGGLATTAAPSSFVTQILSGVNKRNMGVELGMQYKITTTWTVSGLATVNQYTYTNNPNLYFLADNPGFYDNSNIILNDYSKTYKDMGTAYLKNYKQGGTPQEAYSLGLRYSSPHYWWVGATFNYLGHNYLAPAPATRTAAFYTDPVAGTPYQGVSYDALKALLAPVQLKRGRFVDLNAGKSWIFGKYYVMLSASANNIINFAQVGKMSFKNPGLKQLFKGTQDYATGGFEQTRNVNYVDYANDMANDNPSFAPKYFYNLGSSYFLNLQVRF